MMNPETPARTKLTTSFCGAFQAHEITRDFGTARCSAPASASLSSPAMPQIQEH
jgi:hypothetical protein